MKLLDQLWVFFVLMKTFFVLMETFFVLKASCFVLMVKLPNQLSVYLGWVLSPPQSFVDFLMTLNYSNLTVV